MQTVGAFLGHQPEGKKYTKSKEFKNNSLFGIEVECEGVRETSGLDLSLWETEPDGSLRNNGLEFRFRDPLFGEDVVRAIENFSKVAKKHKYIFSKRCSVHVHLDCRDMSFEQLRALCFLYCLLEPYLFSTFGTSRKNNIYCLPWSKADAELQAAAEFIKTSVKTMNKETPPAKEINEPEDIAIPAPEGLFAREVRLPRINNHHMNKYTAFNLSSLTLFGSIELRVTEGTADYDTLLRVCKVLDELKAAAMYFSDEVYTTFFELYSTTKDPACVLSLVFSSDVASAFTKALPTNKEMKTSVKYSKYFMLLSEDSDITTPPKKEGGLKDKLFKKINEELLKEIEGKHVHLKLKNISTTRRRYVIDTVGTVKLSKYFASPYDTGRGELPITDIPRGTGIELEGVFGSTDIYLKQFLDNNIDKESRRSYLRYICSLLYNILEIYDMEGVDWRQFDHLCEVDNTIRLLNKIGTVITRRKN